MTTLSSTFRLASLKGTDPVNISIAPTLSIGNPSASGSITTAKSGDGYNSSVLVGGTNDAYVFIRNTGASTAGNVLVTDGTGTRDIALLKPQDFLFVPFKKAVGCRVQYETEVTSVDWVYWTRP